MGRIFKHLLTSSAFLSAMAAGSGPPLIAERLDDTTFTANTLPAQNGSASLARRDISVPTGWTFKGCWRCVWSSSSDGLINIGGK
jgi:hypothetical protein